MSGRWFLTVRLDAPDRLVAHWLDDKDLILFGIEGKLGDEYHVLDDKSDAKSRIVGEIQGDPAGLLNALVDMFGSLNGGEHASQDLRFRVVTELIGDVVAAVRRMKA
jgi:hypothetical protein